MTAGQIVLKKWCLDAGKIVTVLYKYQLLVFIAFHPNHRYAFQALHGLGEIQLTLEVGI